MPTPAERKEVTACSWHCFLTMLLCLTLALSALLMNVALRSATYAWLAWINLVPLFLAVRFLRPAAATLCGIMWGSCFYIFSVVILDCGILPSFLSLVLLAVVPGIYAGLGSLLTRAIGFNPIVLAFGWVMVAVALKSFGLNQGLFADTPGEETHLHLLSHLLGYLAVTFLLAWSNASLLVILSNVFVIIPRRKSSVVTTNVQSSVLLKKSICLKHMESHPGFARAPPLRIIKANRNSMGKIRYFLEPAE